MIADIIDALIDREGGYSNRADDAGGPTKYGITWKTARAEGWTGHMEDLPRDLAVRIYTRRYIEGPGFDAVAELSAPIARELIDTGVNMGPHFPSVWLQRWLNALNRGGRDYADVFVDGHVGPMTLEALRGYLKKRNRGREGERVMLVALNCSQGARYLDIAEGRPSDEANLYGWLLQRVVSAV